MSINGNGDTFTIKGAKLKVSGGVQVSGSISYTDDATGFGGVTAQIDADNTTLNITAGKTSGVAKIERGTTTNITDINHANVSNNTTIHIALKNTSSNKGDFVTIGTFENDDTVKVNYTEEYVIAPGETGMLTLRKVAGVLSLFIREMFSSTATDFDTANTPFYIKDGVDYKYPLYKSTGANLVTETIGGVTYYRPSSGLKTKSRPPLGIPELIVSPSGNLAIGNNGTGTTVNYDVWGVPSSFDFGSIYQGTTKKSTFILENGQASGSFTESGASSGDAYALYIDKIDASTSDTVTFDENAFIGTIAFHHDTFANSGDPYGDGTLAGATANNHVFADTQTGTYAWGTLGSASTTSTETTYTWTPPNEITGADVLMVAGGGGGGGSHGGGGGAGGLLFYERRTLNGQKTIVVGNGGGGGIGYDNDALEKGTSGGNTSFTDLTTAIGGGGGGGDGAGPYRGGLDGGSGGGSGYSNGIGGSGTPGQGFSGGSSTGDGGSGGGGAGGAGSITNNGNGGDGGVGRDYSSVFGTTYGDGGYFASGGGGSARGTNTQGTASLGGGSDGKNGSEKSDDAQKHTGGGGGGAHYNGSSNEQLGGNGGSGIVLIKSTGIGKIIPKVFSLSGLTTSNVVFTTEGTGIDKIFYSLDGGNSFSSTSSGQLYSDNINVGTYRELKTIVTYPVDSNGIQLSANRSYTRRISTFDNPIALFLDMGTTVTDSINNLTFTTDSGSFKYDTTNNAIKNSGSARMKLDFTSVRADRSTAISVFYEFYLPNNTDYGYAASLGGVHDTTGNNQDAIGWYGHDSTTPITHYYANGTLTLPTQYNYSNYYGEWIKLGWVREANGNNFKVYVDGVYVHTHTPSDGSLTGTGVLSYFYLFRHACGGDENKYTTDDAISFRNLEIYQASFTDAEILAAYGS